MTEISTDPRPQLRATLDQTQRQVDTVRPSQLDLPTPCAEFDLQTLLAHLVAVLRKLTIVGHGGDMTLVADPATAVVDEWADVFQRARSEFDQTWAVDGKLVEDFALAWGTMTGTELLDAYTHEFTVHAWDLSQATSRSGELDPELAEAALDWFSRNIGEDDRVEGGPFGAAVPVARDADIYTLLAGFVGRPV